MISFRYSAENSFISMIPEIYFKNNKSDSQSIFIGKSSKPDKPLRSSKFEFCFFVEKDTGNMVSTQLT